MNFLGGFRVFQNYLRGYNGMKRYDSVFTDSRPSNVGRIGIKFI